MMAEIDPDVGGALAIMHWAWKDTEKIFGVTIMLQIDFNRETGQSSAFARDDALVFFETSVS